MTKSITVRLLPIGPELVVQAGERVLDALDEHARGGLPTACRAANCGICLVEVTAGAGALAPPSARETRLLGVLGAPPTHRLGCQIAIRTDSPEREDPVILVVQLALKAQSNRR